MTRVIPINKTKKSKNNAAMMMPAMDMQDLGLGEIPDLLFTEQLDVVPQDYKNEPQQQENSLFQDLEEFNDMWIQKESTTKEVKKPNNILEAAIDETDLASFIADNEVFINQLSPASSEAIEENMGQNAQNLIQEMEEFLRSHENKNKESEPVVVPQLTTSESRQAEDILDALLAGNIQLDQLEEPDPTTNDEVMMDTSTSEAHEDSGYLSNVSNISEVTTEDGQKVVIIIANDHQQEQSLQDDSSSDPEWSPESPPAVQKKKAVKKTPVKAGKVEKKRGPYKRSAHHKIKDRKERKKLQNVEAARRYRDRKKAEANTIEEEEAQLAEKNRQLRSKVGEMEAEMKTLKKLMVELGLVK